MEVPKTFSIAGYILQAYVHTVTKGLQDNVDLHKLFLDWLLLAGYPQHLELSRDKFPKHLPVHTVLSTYMAMLLYVSDTISLKIAQTCSKSGLSSF